jgi:hypothetical protein
MATPCGYGCAGRFNFVFAEVAVEVAAIVPRLAESCHDLDSTLFHASQGEQAVGDALQTVGPTANDDDLQAQIVIDVNVQRRAHLLAQLVLKVGQPLAEVAHMVVVYQRQCCDGIHGLGHFGPSHLGARQIAKKLRARTSALANHGIEIAQQGAFERDTESNQGILHGYREYRARPWCGTGISRREYRAAPKPSSGPRIQEPCRTECQRGLGCGYRSQCSRS